MACRREATGVNEGSSDGSIALLGCGVGGEVSMRLRVLEAGSCNDHVLLPRCSMLQATRIEKFELMDVSDMGLSLKLALFKSFKSATNLLLTAAVNHNERRD